MEGNSSILARQISPIHVCKTFHLVHTSLAKVLGRNPGDEGRLQWVLSDVAWDVQNQIFSVLPSGYVNSSLLNIAHFK